MNKLTTLTMPQYKQFSNYLKKCDINSFKIHRDINVMTEHYGNIQDKFAKDWYSEIIKLNMLTTKQINTLLQLNDSVGKPKLSKIHPDLVECSPNSLKYIYYSLLSIQYYKKYHNEFTVVEIGCGYGGHCIIFTEICKILNIKVLKYIMIDLPDVNTFQMKYVSNFNLDTKIICTNSNNYKSHSWANEKNMVLFSSYALSEMNVNFMNEYVTTLFPHVSRGFIVWNTHWESKNEYFLKYKTYVVEDEKPLTAKNNKFIYF